MAVLAAGGQLATAQQPVPEIPAHVLGHVGGATGVVAVDGDLAVLAVGRGLVVLDLSTDTPRTLGRLADLGADTVALALIGRRAYAVTALPELVIVDLADAVAPRVRGRLAMRDVPVAMTATGSLALVAAGNAGLAVVDTVDPDQPRTLVRVLGPPEAGAFSVAVAAGYAYVGQNRQLAKLDLADPGSPRMVARTARGTSPQAVAVVGPVVAAGDINSGYIDLYDRTDLSSRDRVAVDGKVRYLAALGSGLVAGGYWRDQSYGGAVWQVDLKDPAAPRLVVGTERKAALAATPYNIVGLAVGRDRAYFTDPRAGLLVMDLSTPGRPSHLAGLPGLGVPSDVAVTGHFALAVDPFNGLMVVDLAAPGGPAIIATDPGARASDRVLIVGRRAYVWQAKRTERYGLASISLYDLAAASPWTAASRLTLQPDGLTALGDYLYLVTAGTLFSYDVSDAEHPLLQSRRDVPSDTAWLAAGEGWLFVLAHESVTLHSFSLNLPNRPNRQGELNLPSVSRLTGVFLDVDGRLYLQDNGTSLTVVDVSVPDAPKALATPRVDVRPVASAGAPGQFWGVRRGTTAVTLDMTKPEEPAVTGILFPNLAVSGLALAGDRLLLNAGGGGLYLVGLGAAPTATAQPSTPSASPPTHTAIPSATVTPVPATPSVTPSALRRTVSAFLPISYWSPSVGR
jgi:hypothetical protein